MKSSGIHHSTYGIAEEEYDFMAADAETELQQRVSVRVRRSGEEDEEGLVDHLEDTNYSCAAQLSSSAQPDMIRRLSTFDDSDNFEEPIKLLAALAQLEISDYMLSMDDMAIQELGELGVFNLSEIDTVHDYEEENEAEQESNLDQLSQTSGESKKKVISHPLGEAEASQSPGKKKNCSYANKESSYIPSIMRQKSSRDWIIDKVVGSLRDATPVLKDDVEKKRIMKKVSMSDEVKLDGSTLKRKMMRFKGKKSTKGKSHQLVTVPKLIELKPFKVEQGSSAKKKKMRSKKANKGSKVTYNKMLSGESPCNKLQTNLNEYNIADIDSNEAGTNNETRAFKKTGGAHKNVKGLDKSDQTDLTASDLSIDLRNSYMSG